MADLHLCVLCDLRNKPCCPADATDPDALLSVCLGDVLFFMNPTLEGLPGIGS